MSREAEAGHPASRSTGREETGVGGCTPLSQWVKVPEDRHASPTVCYMCQPFDGVEVGYRKYSINFALSEFALEEPS